MSQKNRAKKILKILNGIVKLLSAQPQKIPLDLKELLNSQTEVK